MLLLFTITIIYSQRVGVGGWITDSHSCTRLPLTLLWIWWNWRLVMLPQLLTTLYCPSLTSIFFSNENGDLAGVFVISRKDNICSSVCGPFSTKSRWQYPFINLIFFISFFLFALLVLKRLNKMAITIIHISHQGSNCCWLPAKGYEKTLYRK